MLQSLGLMCPWAWRLIAGTCRKFHICVSGCVCVYIYVYRTFHNVLGDYIYNKETKGPTSMELFTATGKLKKVF